MAEAIATNQDLFMCSICLDILKDPIVGQNCLECIKGFWNQEDAKGVYSCPRCRHTFSPRPVLNKNHVFAQLVDHFRKRIEAAVPAQCNYAEQGDAACDVCTGRKLKAVKSCLDCLLSYCEAHFKVHNDLHPGRQHKVVDATAQLQDRICRQHEKPLEIFCRTDQTCVCFLCMVDEHKGHDTISASAGRKEKQILGETQWRLRLRIQEREKEQQDLTRAVKTLKNSAQTAVNDSERMFAEMIHSLEKRCSEVTKSIRAQEKADVSRAEGLLKQLEQEIVKLKRKDAEMGQLSHTEDHIHFLKVRIIRSCILLNCLFPALMFIAATFNSIRVSSTSKDLPSIHVSKKLSFEVVTQSVSSLKKQLEEICKREVTNVSSPVSIVQAIFTELKTREDFLNYYSNFTLDPNTASGGLQLSDGNSRVDSNYRQSWSGQIQSTQVLCKEGVSGRCYWEVTWSGSVSIAVSYKSNSSIGMRGNRHSVFGCNDQSWSLETHNCVFKYKNEVIRVPRIAKCNTVGVYVDLMTGTLAFYSVSGSTMTLVHEVHTTFTDTLYPGFEFLLGGNGMPSVSLL
ncbi:tripartite motif-containing protein 16-like [Engraulis encrasicolus]|uniref:tripartite motif-containing protein 16-like n=1 Tax=Engraulis encrasicolus TaxID=184585 RepID=UPI002FD6661D